MSSYEGGPGHYQPMQPMPPMQQPKKSNGKTIAIVGGVAAAALVVGGGALAATMFFSSGAQPAEALPESTIAYVGVDLDPSGSQKVEAIKFMRKFPAIKENLEVEEGDDLVESLFDEAIGSGACGDLNYADDVKPWLGSRAAMALVDGGEQPAPVFVVQVSDEDKGTEGIENLISSCGGDSTEAGVSVTGEWAVFAETQELADTVSKDAASSPLSDDADYKKWTDEAGGDAILSAYLSPKVSEYADDISSLAPSPSDVMAGTPDPYESEFGDDFDTEGTDPLTDTDAEVKAALEKFQGAAVAVRFEDSGIEIEAAGGVPEDTQTFLSDTAGDLVGNLPAESIAAVGIGLDEGWLDEISKQLDSAGLEGTLDDSLSEMGLEKSDLEEAFGEGVAFAVGEGIDPDAISNGGPEELPAGLVVDADTAAVQSLIDKMSDYAGTDVTTEAPWIKPEEGDGVTVISPNDDYRAKLADPGDTLSGTDEYKDVVDGADDPQAVFFINFNADDDWLARLAERDSQEAADNLKPLAAFGLVGWVDGDVSHVKLKLTTD